KKHDEWVPQELDGNQKNRRFEVASARLLYKHYDALLCRLVKCDGKWILYDSWRRS
ncbi:hypothetical protein Angca_008302, partial [Angiostrongylus cantonensis]